MENKMKAIIVMLPLLLNACASMEKSIVLGASVGAIAGGAIGQNSSNDSSSAAVGALIGAGLGSLIGYSAFNSKKVNTAEIKSSTPDDDLKYPRLTTPRVRSYVVPDTIEGNKFIKSHRVFILEDPGSWTR